MQEREDSADLREQAFLAQIQGGNTVQRIENDDGSVDIETEKDGKYKIEKIEAGKDPRVKESHALLASTFGRPEVDSLRTIRTAIDGKVVGDEESADTPLLVHTVRNEQGKVIGTNHSAVLETLNPEFEGTGNGVALQAYTAVEKGHEGKGIGKEMLRKSVTDALKHARERNVKLAAIITEATAEAPEGFYNSIGMRRMYFENAEGKLVEVPYRQSELADDWDPGSGNPREGAEKVALHLMTARLDQQTHITADEVMGYVRAIMNYDSFQTEGYFKNQHAYSAHETTLQKDLHELVTALKEAKDGKIMLMTEAERNTWRTQHGKDSVIEHVG
ncbi:MAG: hypothetical protein A2898_03375 [Candidatus Kerfeldbacteria bacterium RIFCSPLOWO2_01_FULL_48_11]|uniref:N-acetyltransferase domain-containing protein n=1 Tax=Candidatus Kerfeldbacteria bacterium RIFCSPLOWO2_01_FULL_48_11 TaxID=1798543 RepID=A0A1G2B2U7_9BACT|nr:MAG: hypothetical protein UY34_C0009G0022 [Parcubacteria group bacterium GW2011_GWA2_48_9]OGY83305.1 MAG: hypothetical protein A2898_03375 [Candidatus Kerfeldbacteria bacterium RIFCSPLOWO2_01_FULL_48_11]HCJ52706.1 hypothetical protein [Candidatus Kerfeldbacteria bacterium]HCM67577.1 hypothetical protein [Candidatus Kerfeldbacteria bacterium]